MSSKNKLPVMVVIGRPNVGKSTLFNRLADRPAAVVFNRPGVTRDILTADVELQNGVVELIDTAGWPYPTEDRILGKNIDRKMENVLKKSTAILWVVDGRSGRSGGEDDFAQLLHRYRKKVILVVNKVDTYAAREPSTFESEFAGLPYEKMVLISAKHGQGIVDLLVCMEIYIPEHSISEEDGNKMMPIRVSIIGKPNVGKSTLLNKILQRERSVVSDIPGTTRDAIENDFVFEGQPFKLVDTAGIRRRARITDGLEKTMTKVSLNSAIDSDVIILMLDITQGFAAQDHKIGTNLWRKGKNIIVVANKWDTADVRSGTSAQDIETHFKKSYKDLRFAPFILCSAKTGHGVHNILKKAVWIAKRARFLIKTRDLNKYIPEWNSKMPPGLWRGKPGKLKFISQVDTNPMVIKVFVNNIKSFRRQSHAYLTQLLRDTFDLQGIPIILKIEGQKPKDAYSR